MQHVGMKPKTYNFAQTSTTTTERPLPVEKLHSQTAEGHARPAKSFRSGAINVSIWENEGVSTDGTPTSYKTVSFERRYKDKTGEWKSTNSLRANDLPKAVLILQKAYEYLVLTESGEEEPIY